MKAKDDKPVRPVKGAEAPLDENPLAKPEKTKKDLAVKKQRKSKTLKDDDWVI